MTNNIYIHVPFCQSKCDYCVFFSQTDLNLIEPYLAKIERDCKEIQQKFGRKFDTLYIGGGTPTLLNEFQLERFFVVLSQCFDLQEFREISIESNPETLNRVKIDILQNHVSRVSMGVQSFNPKLREILGRHTSNQAIMTAIELINESKIENFNLDLIYAIPTQKAKDFEKDLEQVRQANATHLSAYNLTIEEQSKLAKRICKIDDNLSIEMHHLVKNFLPFKQYEISNYAIADAFKCQHNINIWQGGKLIGLGPSASSFDGINRYTNSSSIRKWLNDEDIEFDIITQEARMNEIFAVNLRTVAGWNKNDFEKIYPNKFEFFRKKCLQLQNDYPKLLEVTTGKIYLTSQGLLFWDEIFMEFLD